MPITSINNLTGLNIRSNNITSVNFGHGGKSEKSPYTAGKKSLIAATSVLGVLGSLLFLTKKAGYTLKPSKIFKSLKSYMAKADYEAKEVITMGVGTCLGGLAGGYLVDKNPENRRAKRRESVMQIGNVSIPILFVHLINKNIFKKSSEAVKAFASLGGVFLGVMTSNIVMNRLNNFLFNEKTGDGRKTKVTDFSAHLDDVVVAANYISKKDWVRTIGRFVPAALVIPGLEIGNKTKN